MTQSKFLAAIALTVVAHTSLAVATPYAFTVNYNGVSASLAPGSDNPLTTTLLAGDTFIYSLIAQGSGQWTVFNGGSIFPFFALSVDPSGTRVGNFTLDLLNNGSTVFTDTENGASNSQVHLGTNTITLPTGLIFDDLRLNYTIVSETAATTPNNLLPWPGVAPEIYMPGNISFAASANPVPEPATLVLFGVGLLGIGALRRRTAKAELWPNLGDAVKDQAAAVLA